MSMADDIEDFRAGLESAPLCAEIARLKEELAKAQAEISRLDNITAIQQKQVERLLDARDAEKAENARLKQYNDELCGDLLDQRGRLRELLGSTVELLQCMDDFVAGSRLCPSRLAINHELARLRAEWRGEKSEIHKAIDKARGGPTPPKEYQGFA